jgi:hypothetical protein
MELVTLIVFAVIALYIFLVCAVDLHNEIGRGYLEDMKSTVNTWYENSRLNMWISNKRNGVTFISDNEYARLQRKGKIKCNIVIGEE